MNRRDFLRFAGAATGALTAGKALADENVGNPTEFVGVLTDTTRCIGCRRCERACAETHGAPVPNIEDKSVFDEERSPDTEQWTVVNRYETEKGEIFVKKQCMHCWQPACTSACLTAAMYKTREGPVVWRGDKCMGCRFCMVSCPFRIPKFEYDEWNPKVQKCNMCWQRLEQGKIPACVEACPTETLIFGQKRELMEIARTRIYKNPKRYVHRIYGAYEVGGTGWLYMAAVPFEQLGFRNDLGNEPLPQLTSGFLYSVPAVFLLVPSFLVGLSLLTEKCEGEEGKEEKKHG
jgi:Fe-S-cluster-containing dehydrogenase component